MSARNVKNFEFRLGRQGVIFFTLGMSLLLFIVFILGVMVGVHIDAYPEKIARGLPGLILKGFYNPAAKTGEIDRAVEKAKIALPDGVGNVASLPDTLVPKEGEAKAPSRPQGEEALPAGGLAGDAGTPQEGRKPPDVAANSGKVPAADMTAAEAQAGKLTAPIIAGNDVAPLQKTGGKYLVQAGSFRNGRIAKELSGKIISLGYEPQVTAREIAGKGKWFRVVIPGFVSREEAEKAVEVLSKNIKGVSCIIRPMK